MVIDMAKDEFDPAWIAEGQEEKLARIVTADTARELGVAEDMERTAESLATCPKLIRDGLKTLNGIFVGVWAVFVLILLAIILSLLFRH